MDRPPEIHFDGWTLRRDSGELRKDGRTIRLQSQSLLVLEELLANPGVVVSRRDLTARLWPKGIVDFNTALNSAVRRLRRALGDQPDGPKYIETVPLRGYRFIGAIAPLTPDEPAQPNAQVKSRVELPDPVPMPHLRPAAVASACCALVGLWIAGDSPQLVATEFDTTPPLISVGGSTGPVAPSDSSTTERLERSRFFLERRAPGDLERARKYFAEVLGTDPSNARAYAGLASVYWLETVEGEIARDTGLREVRASAEHALALDPGQAEAHYRLAQYSWVTGNNTAGDRQLQRASELSPQDATLLAIRASRTLEGGRVDEAVELSQRAVIAAPLNLALRYNLACALYLAGRFDEALRVMQEILEFDPAYRADIVAFIWILRGRCQDAVRLAQTWPDGADKWQVLALAYFGLKRKVEADRTLATLIDQVRNSEPLRIVEVYAYRHRIDRALEWLDAADKLDSYGQGKRAPGFAPAVISFSPFLAPLRADPMWQRRLAVANQLHARV